MVQKTFGLARASAAILAIVIILAAGGTYFIALRINSSSSTFTQSNTESVQISSTASLCTTSNSMSYKDVVPLAYGVAGSNLWNLRSANGDVRICYQQSGIFTTIGLANISAGLKEPGDFVGYPNAGYGYSAGDTPFGEMNPNLVFPMKLESLQSINLASSISYSITSSSSQPLDFAYDLWLEGNPQPNEGAQNGDLELMIWMDNQTFKGPGPQTGTFITPATVNGNVVNSTWAVHESMPTPQREHELVVYLLTPAMNSGNISIDIWSFVKDAIANYWSPPSNPLGFYLMGIDVGSEFAAAGGTASYDWQITSYILQEPSNSITLVS